MSKMQLQIPDTVNSESLSLSDNLQYQLVQTSLGQNFLSTSKIMQRPVWIINSTTKKKLTKFESSEAFNTKEGKVWQRFWK